MLFTKLTTKSKAVLIIEAIAMLMGTSTHVTWALENGFMSKHYNASTFSMVFWDSLTFLDPLAAILLFVKPKIGLILTFLIITFDVIHNNTVHYEELYEQTISFGEWVQRYWMIAGQLIFAVFVMIAFRPTMRSVRIKSKLN